MCQSVRDIDEREESGNELDELEVSQDQLHWMLNYAPSQEIMQDPPVEVIETTPVEITTLMEKLGMSEEDYQNKNLTLEDLQLILSTAKDECRETRPFDTTQKLDTSEIEKVINFKTLTYEMKHKKTPVANTSNIDTSTVKLSSQEAIDLARLCSPSHLWSLIEEEYGRLPEKLHSSTTSRKSLIEDREILNDFIESRFTAVANKFKKYFKIKSLLEQQFPEIKEITEESDTINSNYVHFHLSIEYYGDLSELVTLHIETLRNETQESIPNWMLGATLDLEHFQTIIRSESPDQTPLIGEVCFEEV